MRMPHIFVASVAAAAAIASPLIAAQDSAIPGQPDASRVVAGTYRADPAHTLVEWEIDHMGFTNYFGLFGNITGTLVFDPKNPSAAKLDITVPVNELTTANAALTKHLSSADFFDVAKYPTARFVSTAIRLDDDDEAAITGNLTLHGVTRPITIEAEFKGAGANPMNKKPTIGFDGEATIRRSDFGISNYVPVVSDTVELKIAGAFEMQ